MRRVFSQGTECFDFVGVLDMFCLFFEKKEIFNNPILIEDDITAYPKYHRLSLTQLNTECPQHHKSITPAGQEEVETHSHRATTTPHTDRFGECIDIHSPGVGHG